MNSRVPLAGTRRSVALAVKAFCGIHLCLHYGLEVHGTFGPSMLPTLNIAGDFCIVDKWRFNRGRNMKVGDLVVASKPGHPDTYILKRIIGMPGDIVLRDPLESRREFVKVPVGHIWIVGDNLPHSTDSRHYGPLPLGLVKGKALGTVYPAVRWFDNDDNGLTIPHKAPIARGSTAP
ncbi:protein of unknown function [Taphrina deformans PYCC 5710]|uniref:Peptidase S26 domain-containing protein n=1 Tax=Taphrina deformans (strain PYCC 5710 / ATCC 11124 / CBS 356.35 / IMI 108563 / JCM 9778 / NBRC 8474) TaxID=1097556 RepID=R4XHE2_TAPDE|nr:protein of unknown function [Taphrina deformans PYCC 5710]|eukprot:CCG83948.1 protein of unknown function [Taphrina deformans PYCC 5710]